MLTTQPVRLFGGTPIRVLLLEESDAAARLIMDELRKGGFIADCIRVDTQAAFTAGLTSTIDVILAADCIPHFTVLAAIESVQDRRLDIPFIILSSSRGDELAVQCIKHGFTDYLSKDRLGRLSLAVFNALEERRHRADWKLMEEQLRQAQKMETMGHLAGGIAHDFGNILTVIMGRVWLLLEHEKLPAPVETALREVHHAGERAANLTRQLLFFSRKRPLERRTLDLNAIVTITAAILRRLLGENIDIQLQLDSRLPAVEADESMMEQILINLAVNARDAMPRGGRLLLTTRSVMRTVADVQASPHARTGTFACISVADSGCGIEPKCLPRIFDRFYTTKEDGKGTGIGLATVFGIVQQHQGWIDVASAVGVGTTFNVYLPFASAAQTPQATVSKPAVTGGTETVLVVEDDETVRELTVLTLRHFGYRVLQAHSSAHALELWRKTDVRIDLLLTDVVMPGTLSGPELADRLQAEEPHLGVIITSGYRAEALPEISDSRRTRRFIHKPFQPRALAHVARDVLDARKMRRIHDPLPESGANQRPLIDCGSSSQATHAFSGSTARSET